MTSKRTKAFGTVVNLLAGIIIVVNIVLVGGLGLGALVHLWIMFDGLQLMSHLPLLDVGTTANVNQFFTKMRVLSTFDIFGIHTFDFLSRYPDPSPHSKNFDGLKYESSFPIQNLSTMFFVTLAYILGCVIYAFVYSDSIKCTKPQPESVEQELKEGGEVADNEEPGKNDPNTSLTPLKTQQIAGNDKLIVIQEIKEIEEISEEED